MSKIVCGWSFVFGVLFAGVLHVADGGESRSVPFAKCASSSTLNGFTNRIAAGADLREADGRQGFRVAKEASLYWIQTGDERYEIPDAVVLGG